MPAFLKRILFALLAIVPTVSSASAATLAIVIPDNFSDGIDFSTVVTVIGLVGGGVIGVFLAIRLVKWVMATFM